MKQTITPPRRRWGRYRRDEAGIAQAIVAHAFGVQIADLSAHRRGDDFICFVCCHLVGLEEAERELGWPKRSGRIVLTLALDRLAEHYGMRVGAPAPRARRIRAWHAPKETEENEA